MPIPSSGIITAEDFDEEQTRNVHALLLCGVVLSLCFGILMGLVTSGGDASLIGLFATITAIFALATTATLIDYAIVFYGYVVFKRDDRREDMRLDN